MFLMIPLMKNLAFLCYSSLLKHIYRNLSIPYICKIPSMNSWMYQIQPNECTFDNLKADNSNSSILELQFLAEAHPFHPFYIPENFHKNSRKYLQIYSKLQIFFIQTSIHLISFINQFPQLSEIQTKNHIFEISRAANFVQYDEICHSTFPKQLFAK